MLRWQEIWWAEAILPPNIRDEREQAGDWSSLFENECKFEDMVDHYAYLTQASFDEGVYFYACLTSMKEIDVLRHSWGAQIANRGQGGMRKTRWLGRI